MYAILYTRPDISFVVGLVSRYQSNGIKHWRKVKIIFRYLNGTNHLKLCFQANKFEVVGYSDVDFARDRDDCKPTSGHVFQFGAAAISCSSKKQTGVA